MSAHVKVWSIIAVLAVLALTLALRPAHGGAPAKLRSGSCGGPGLPACPFGPPPVVKGDK